MKSLNTKNKNPLTTPTKNKESQDTSSLLQIDAFVKTNGLSPKTQRDNRALAFQILYAIDRCDYMLSCEEILEGFAQNYGLDINYDGFCMIIVEGVLNSLDSTDRAISTFLQNWHESRISCTVKILLRMGIWELNSKLTPEKAVIDEYIELAKAFGEKDSFRIVNGVLDAYIKSTPVESIFAQEQLF